MRAPLPIFFVLISSALLFLLWQRSCRSRERRVAKYVTRNGKFGWPFSQLMLISDNLKPAIELKLTRLFSLFLNYWLKLPQPFLLKDALDWTGLLKHFQTTLYLIRLALTGSSSHHFHLRLSFFFLFFLCPEKEGPDDRLHYMMRSTVLRKICYNSISKPLKRLWNLRRLKHLCPLLLFFQIAIFSKCRDFNFCFNVNRNAFKDTTRKALTNKSGIVRAIDKNKY